VDRRGGGVETVSELTMACPLFEVPDSPLLVEGLAAVRLDQLLAEVD